MLSTMHALPFTLRSAFRKRKMVKKEKKGQAEARADVKTHNQRLKMSISKDSTVK